MEPGHGQCKAVVLKSIKKMNKAEIIDGLLELLLKHRRTQFKREDFSEIEKALKMGIIHRLDLETELYEIDMEAPTLMEAFWEMAKVKVGPFPKNIPEVSQKIERLDEILKEENGIKANVIGTYSAILRGLHVFLLGKLEEQGVDVGTYYEDYLGHKAELKVRLFHFDRCFFRFLPRSGYPADRVLKLCKLGLANEDNYNVLDFARLLAKANFGLANEVYARIKKGDGTLLKGFRTNLAIGLYNGGMHELFEEYKERITEEPDEAFRFFQVIDKKDKKTLETIFGIVASDDREENRVRKADVLSMLINHQGATKKIRQRSFDLIKSYFESENEEVKHGVLWSINYITDFEEERFGILMAYLTKTSNFKVLTNFFWRFKDPKYMYGLLRACYYQAWGRSSISFFKEAIGHFWQVNRDASEKQIFAMFDPQRQLGLLPVEVLMCGYMNPLPVDLLKLDSEDKQINAIRCICIFPHSFDSLLPIVLKLKDSKFPKVNLYLKERLAQLIVEVYHELLFESIKGLLGTTAKDKMFLREMTKAFDRHKEIKVLKDSVDDLNPMQNERDFMDLFYNLEHERRSILMEEIHQSKDSFMSHAKRSVIVRGNAWKMPEKEEITPLQRFAAGHWMHGNAVLNPDLFELELRNI